VLSSTEAAGTLLLRGDRSRLELLAAGLAAHVVISLGWAQVLARVLPRRHPVLAGAMAGVGIAALDLGLVGRRFPAIRRLRTAPQVLDHIAYGATLGAVLGGRELRNGRDPVATGARRGR
jgi:hypothetical protein